MIILGIETTCDETGVGIVTDGREILANVVSSSADFHKKFGGVVPEVAAREQVRLTIPVIDQALRQAKLSLANIDIFAVAFGPGLAGSLLIGVETSKTMAVVLRKRIIGVNHLIGHLYANWLTVKSSQLTERGNSEPQFPLVALIVSGGHTDLLLMTDHNKYKWLGGTRDDAAGEAFDKVARILGLGYPGGPEIERVAQQFTVHSSQLTVKLPRPMMSEDNFDFSFSGIKTAVANLVRSDGFVVYSKEKISHEFQEAIVDVLIAKTLKAARKFNAKSIVVGGGVAANGYLRSQFSVHSSEISVPVFFPPIELCVDNGSMIASAAFFQKKFADPLKLSANPSLYFT